MLTKYINVYNIYIMLNWVIDFYKSHKCVILWTIGYFIATWAVMYFMFDFNILSAYRWHQLMHAHLRGFPGFVFGILVLAAVPMYVATTIVIAKTQKPLFTIPEFIKRAFTQTPMDEEKSVEESVTPNTDQENTDQPLPENIPSELRAIYARAREHIGRTPQSVFDLGNMTQPTTEQKTEPAPEKTEPTDIPIPTDFDIEDIDDIDNSIPHFTEINFDDDDDNDDTEEPVEFDDIKTISDTTNPVTEFLSAKSIPHKTDGDVVITDKFAIIAHTDPEFWVADTESWFAAGKTRPSPIKLVKSVASAHNVEPVLYLGTDNIMDIDNLIPQWESDGVRVITDLNDLI